MSEADLARSLFSQGPDAESGGAKSRRKRKSSVPAKAAPSDPADSSQTEHQGDPQIVALQQAVKEAQDQAHTYQEQIETLQQALQDQQVQAQTERHSLQEKLDQTQVLMQQQQEQIQYLRSALQRLQQEKDDLEAKLQKTQHDLQAAHLLPHPSSAPAPRPFPSVVIQRPVAPNTSPTDLDVPPYLLD